jgi:VanZ family protein
LAPAQFPAAERSSALRLLARLAFWSACIVAFVMAVMPVPPEIPASDKLQHIFAFVVLALLGRLAYPDVKKRWLLVGLMAFGALIEIVQALPIVGRDSDPLDWVADTAAALTVFVIVALWSYLQDRRTAR